MKVLWFANTPCGATERLTGKPVLGGGWLYSLSEELKNYVELHIAFYWGEPMNPFEHKGICFHPVLRLGFGSKMGRYIYRLRQQFDKNVDLPEIERLQYVFNEVEPDIVHFHGTEENFGLLAERIVAPMCLSIQGMLSPYFYKLYSGYQRKDVCKSQSLRQKIMLDGFEANERKMRIRSERERRILKTIPVILGRTCWDRDCTLALNPSRKFFVCNEILRSEFLESEWELPSLNGAFVITTTVSNGLYKGLEMIYQTASLLRYARFDFRWNVIGVAEDDSFAKITRKITEITPQEVNIHLLGRKDASEMIKILKESHAFVQVSHIENSPNSLCEAMVLGMPIIASYAGGTSSLLQDGKEGVLVQDGDPYRLAGSILGLYNDYQNAVKMGQKARERALVRHNPQYVLNELLSVYHMILKDR
jgi:glycosyltransferase involved in cell wall biosynthesis